MDIITLILYGHHFLLFAFPHAVQESQEDGGQPGDYLAPPHDDTLFLL